MTLNLKNRLKFSLSLVIFIVILVVNPALKQEKIPVINWYLMGLVLTLYIFAFFYKNHKYFDNRKAGLIGIISFGFTILLLIFMYFYYRGINI